MSCMYFSKIFTGKVECPPFRWSLALKNSISLGVVRWSLALKNCYSPWVVNICIPLYLEYQERKV